MCYISISPTTQENKMNSEDERKSIEVLRKASLMAKRYGHALMNDCAHDSAVGATSAAIIFSTICAAADMSMHDAMSLFMSVHKQTESFSED